MMETAKVTLVTVIAVPELEGRLVKDLRALGVKGYTLSRVDGRGMHGQQMAGLADAPNVRLEMLVAEDLAHKVLDRIATRYSEQPIMAYVHEVAAVPAGQFR
jgi:nitrogen regulatory protein PII